MQLPAWTWTWAWAAFLRWSLHPTLMSAPSARERWQVVAWCLWPGIRHHYLLRVVSFLHRRLPTAVLLRRLQRHDAGWYRVPSVAASVHLHRRLGVNVVEGDFVQFELGMPKMRGFVDDELQVCEYWQIADE